MNPLTPFLKKLAILFRRGRFGSELEEEIAFHRAQAEEELVASGMTPEAAHYAAMRRFGNEMKLMEQSHEEVTFRVETVVQDLHFALRQWRRNPGFALTAVLILALGMGVSVAIFGFVDAAQLPSPPPISRLLSIVYRHILISYNSILRRRFPAGLLSRFPSRRSKNPIERPLIPGQE